MLSPIYDLITFFLNHIITHIPFWNVRKLFYRASGMKMGRGTRILMGTVIYCPWKIVMGDNVVINEEVIIDGRGG